MKEVNIGLSLKYINTLGKHLLVRIVGSKNIFNFHISHFKTNRKLRKI